MTLIRVVTALLVLLAPAVVAVAPGVIQAQQFVNSHSQKRLLVLGVDYQPGGAAAYNPENGRDPLSDGDACLRDAAILQMLGANTIRVYTVNPATNHDLCMSIFNAAGLYVILDVNSALPDENLNRADPKSSYHRQYLERVFTVIEAFKYYPNTLAFFAGNEVINEDAVINVGIYLRAIIRDMKQYIYLNSDRKIPVGYSAADIRPILEDTGNYLSCEIADSPGSGIDFLGLNSYSWCGDASYTSSGYDKLVALFSGASFPVFFSEYGCNAVKPRKFTEVGAIYGEQMTQALDGGLVYEFSQEANDYGLVQLNDDNSATLLTDYDNLLKQYRKLNITLLESLDPATTNIKPARCSSDLIKDSKYFENNFKLPDPPDGVPEMIKNGIPNPPMGKLVNITDTKPKYGVLDSNGHVLSLEIKILNDFQSNVPGQNISGVPGPTADNNTKKAAANSVTSFNTLSLVALLTGLTLLII
ncbi:beta glucanosyltransferase Gel2p [Histoplasma capsulatum]|uniref:1,3-beta-glucanosyltransferase n=1 Tax=Ajellomyces capsulatus TaxID=5037 RepID=A0A8A1LXL9_AJECA|nr:hypothetical protein HCAG_08363 [Histoplasma mississippiense (nom. inval.)]EDN04701.1 hypothetical protein HCAG_08363 [Histoplasma mississippiense (nom. inval.)]QSS57965.1 beta glucanosyltransferase Gel2p [Histoplasma capsulatum]